MDFFDYISESDPAGTADVIQSYGYNICNYNLAECSRDLVNFEGEDALKKLCALHPDKDLILQYFGGGNFHGADGLGNGRIAAFDVIREKKVRMESKGIDNNMMLVFLMSATLLITAAIITK